MKLYCAGRIVTPISEPVLLRWKINRLWSYYAVRNKVDEAFNLDRENGTAFLDSGAFSALTQGCDIDLEEYIDYLHAVDPAVGYAAALDVIGDFDATQRNYERMACEDFRFPIYSTIHFPATREQICRAVDSLKWPYLAIGGLVPIATRGNTLRDFLDYVWRAIRRHKENIRVHCFGITRPDVLMAYPFYSADSTAGLVNASRFGKLMRYPRGRQVAIDVNNDDPCGWTLRRIIYKEILGRGDVDYVTRNYMRVIANARDWLKYELFITELWRRRGVVWGA